MRILITVDVFPAMSEPFVTNHVIGMLERGHDVSIVATNPKGDGPMPLNGVEFGLEQRFSPMYLGDSPTRKTRWFDAPRILSNALKVLAYHPGYVASLMNKGRKTVLRLMPPGNRAPNHGYYNVVHSHFGTSARRTLGLILAGKLSTGAFIPNFHGTDTRTYGRHSAAAYRTVFKHAATVIANSEFLRQRLIGLGCPKEKIAVIRNGIYASNWEFRERSLQDGEKLSLLSIGRLVPVKGHIYAIKAVQELCSEIEFEYTIVGSGPLLEELSTYCRENKLDRYVKLVGAEAHETVMARMAKAHILIHPSIKDAKGNEEGGPVALREAAASGCLAIASNNGGMPESVEHGVTGMLVPSNEPEAITQAITDLVNQKSRWPEMSTSARKMAEEQFDNDKNYELVQQLYQKALLK